MSAKSTPQAKKRQAAIGDSVPEPALDTPSQLPATTWISQLGNVALLSVVSLAIGYLWLLSYARAEDIPLRVHGDGVGALVPWIAGTAAALLATPVGLVVFTAAMIRLPMLSSTVSLHDYLRDVEWKGSADTDGMRLRVSFWAFGVPMGISIALLTYRFMGGWIGHVLLWLFLPAAVIGTAVFFVLHRGRSHESPMLIAFVSYMLVLLFVTGISLTLPAGIALAFGISNNGALLGVVAVGSIVWWALVTLVAVGNGERIREDARGLAMGSAAIVLVLSSFPDIASNFAATSLRAMGLGSTTISLRLRADTPVHAGDGRYMLVLDTGSQLYVRPCGADVDQQGVDVIAWTSVERIEPQRRLLSESNPCE